MNVNDKLPTGSACPTGYYLMGCDALESNSKDICQYFTSQNDKINYHFSHPFKDCAYVVNYDANSVLDPFLFSTDSRCNFYTPYNSEYINPFTGNFTAKISSIMYNDAAALSFGDYLCMKNE